MLLAAALLLSAAPPVIGVATSNGVFRLAGTAVVGTGTVKEGAIVETETKPARLLLYSGASIDVGNHSRVKVFPDRLVVEDGTSVVRGKMQVLSREGILVARVAADAPVSVSAPAKPSSEAELTGVVEAKDNGLLIHDEMTHLTFPLEASTETMEKLKQSVGKRVTVKGTLQGGRVMVVGISAAAVVAAATTATAATTVAATGATAGTAATAATTATVAAATAAKAGAVALGVSKAVVVGVTVASVGAAGATVGVVQAAQSETISQ